MKIELYCLIASCLSVGLMSVSARADAPHIASLAANAVSYSVGAHAVLMAYLPIQPDDLNYEFHLSAQFADQDIKVVRVTDSEAFSSTTAFTQPGTYKWVVNVYLQEKQAAHDLEAAIHFYRNEISQLQMQLSSETDPAVIAQLQAQIARDQSLATSAQGELSAGRRLVEQDCLNVTVSGTPPVVIDVNAGGTAYSGSDGTVWGADAGFSGGTMYTSNIPVTGTADSALYQTVRYGTNFGYSFSVPNGTYSVTLKFAEIFWTSAGSRVFNVAINGTPVLQNFDIFAAAHGANIALDETFPVIVTNGQISIGFTTVTDNADIAAIRIVQTGK